MKRVLLIVSLIISSCTSFHVSYGVKNNSSVKPLACILHLDYSVEEMPHGGAPYSTGVTEVWFTRDNRCDWRSYLPDSIAIFIIDPSLVDIRILTYHRDNDYLTPYEARQVNENPECIIAKYFLSEEQFMDKNRKYTVFPPTKGMKKSVRMWPSYEDLITNYGD